MNSTLDFNNVDWVALAKELGISVELLNAKSLEDFVFSRIDNSYVLALAEGYANEMIASPELPLQAIYDMIDEQQYLPGVITNFDRGRVRLHLRRILRREGRIQ